MRVDGQIVGEIGRGLVVLVGFAPEDGESEMVWMADKLWGLRVFSDDEGKMNLSASDVDAS